MLASNHLGNNIPVEIEQVKMFMEVQMTGALILSNLLDM